MFGLVLQGKLWMVFRMMMFTISSFRMEAVMMKVLAESSKDRNCQNEHDMAGGLSSFTEIEL
jgi:hypothetical protein